MLSFYGSGYDLAVCRITVEVRQFCRSDSDLTIHWNLDQPLFDKRPAQRFDRTYLLQSSFISQHRYFPESCC